MDVKKQNEITDFYTKAFKYANEELNNNGCHITNRGLADEETNELGYVFQFFSRSYVSHAKGANFILSEYNKDDADIIAKDSDYNIEIKFYDINTKAIAIKRYGVNDKVKNKNYAFTLAIVQREINDEGLSNIKNIYYFYDCHFYDFTKSVMTIKQLKELFPNYHEEKIS